MTTNETATLAGGCFWCLEAVFDQLKGVESVTSGYSGGYLANPTYRQVCSETTGHAEVVQLSYDPQVLSFRDILNVFFSTHDPTTLNRQGNDIGSSYRSAIFYHDDSQKATAEQVIRELTEQKLWSDPIVTEVTKFDKFFLAEDYHQEYFANNPDQPYCRVVVAPKVTKFRKKFVDRLKK
jgi:peptide-methionine (S)-S-oxide reductase